MRGELERSACITMEGTYKMRTSIEETSVLNRYAVMKNFSGNDQDQIYLGVVIGISYDNRTNGNEHVLYHVLYSDNDEEDLDESEFAFGRKLYLYVKQHQEGGMTNIMLQGSELRKMLVERQRRKNKQIYEQICVYG